MRFIAGNPDRRSTVLPRPLLIVLVVSFVALLATEAAALRPHVREGWQMGVSYGTAVGDVNGTGGETVEFEDGVSPQIRAARMVTSNLALGLTYAGWMYETGEYPLKFRISMQNLLLGATWYPGRAQGASGGIVVRGGVGLGWLGVAAVVLQEDEEQGHGEREEYAGLALELNVSYEFRITENVAAGIGLGANGTTLDDDVFDSTVFYPLTANLNWYWD